MEYDLIIIGAGPAGLTAGVYAARYNIKTMIIGKVPGGLASEAYKICNFPTYKEISGMEFSKRMEKQVRALGVDIRIEEAKHIRKNNSVFLVKTNTGEYSAKKIIVACGTKKRKMGVEGEEKFEGLGISYCATCDGPLFKDKIVGVIGGGNSALTSALLLSQYAKKVYIIYRQERFFRPDPAWIDLVEKNKKINTLFKAVVVKLHGDKFLKRITLSNGMDLEIDGLFVEIGGMPCNDLARQLKVELDDAGYIIVDKRQRTNVEGVLAAGDVTNSPLKQIITAASQGAVAAQTIFEEMQKK